MKKLFLLLSLCCISFAAWGQVQDYIDENQLVWTYNVNDTDNPEYITVAYINVPNSISELVFPDSLPYNEKLYPVKEITGAYGCGIIGDYEVKNAISSIKLPSGLMAITDSGTDYSCGTFYGFSNLNSITLPASLTTIGQNTFNECWSLHTIYMEATTPPSTYSPGVLNRVTMGTPTFVVPSSSLALYKDSEVWKDYTIYCKEELVDYTYTDSNGVIWTYRLDITNASVRISSASGYTTELIFPATIPHEGKECPITEVLFGFYNDENLIKVDLSKTKIKETGCPMYEYDFNCSECHSLQTVLFPSTLEKIGTRTFYKCSNLQTINWENLTSLKIIDYDAFASDWEYRFSKITSINLTATQLESIGSRAFYEFNGLQEIQFPSSLNSIGSEAFYNCSLGSVDLSHTAVSVIKSSVFKYCYNLHSIVLPSSLKEIEYEAFYNNPVLKKIDLSNVEIIGEGAFSGCNNITTVDLSAATTIASNAFTSSATFTINSVTPATIKSNSFTEDSKFVVSPDAYDTFCSAAIWSNWKDNISMYTIDSNNIKWIYRYIADSNSMCITSASGYSTEVTVPSALSYNGTDYPVTHLENAFRSANITSIVLPATLTHIGDYAFANSKLSSITIPASVTTIGSYAFYFNYLASVTFEPNSALESIGEYAFAAGDEGSWSTPQFTSIEIPASVKNIGVGAFQYCSSLNSIDLSKVETIGDNAFNGACITSADLSSATSIGSNAFTYTNDGAIEPFFTINNNTPAIIESGAFSTNSMFLVPGSAVADYKTANVWSDYASRIFGSDVAIQNLTLSAKADRSDLEVQIGDENLLSVVDLTIKGSINSYDFMVMRNKMPFLRRLDLSEASIVENSYEHYTGYHTEDNKFPGYGLYNCKLVTLELPQSVTEIGEYALANISYLNEVVIPAGVTAIGERAFYYCTDLRTVVIPDGVTELGYSTFYGCGNLETINIPKGVTNIQGQTFSECYNLKSIVLPPTIESIGWYAFNGCRSLKELRIPSSVRRIEDGAFSNTNIDDVYVYVVEPFDINQQTFAMTGNNFIGTLHAPKVSYWSYYYNTQWSQFLDFEEFDEPYENFYLEGDKVLDGETGHIRGEEGKNPDAELGDGAGLTVEDDVVQDLGNVDIEHNGDNGASIIVDGTGEVNADNLHVHINVQSGRWYFFCFPFDLKKENISMGKEGTQYVFRWYDGKERANGNSGWKNVTEEEGSYLKAAVGYIFQCSQSDVLTISLKDVKFKKEKKYNELVANAAENLQDASWNFVGNPYLSYYDMNSVGYDAPITVWNGSTYEAIKPGDDDYHFAPFEAFFVQKPEGTSAMEFDAEAQTTLKGSQEQQATGARSIARAINPDRKLVNIVLSNGEKSDRTRIVFNDKVSMEYEMECDAAKFDAAGVPQLYTLDSRAVKYAINERPVAEGVVTLGYSAPAEGTYTLEAPRMDTKVFVKDNLTRTIHDLSVGNYEFYSEAGTFEGRFTILTKSGATGIDGVVLDEQQDERIYNLNGQRVNKATGKGIYIKNNRKEVNM